jgi:hypothetical protein
MPEPIEAANYLVFHPENQRRAVSVRAKAIVSDTLVDSWVGQVWVDSPGGNEDPFVFGSSWAYSYCHATQLRRRRQRRCGYLTNSSCILFCSGDHADEDVLAVDTIFWISEAHEWVSPSEPPFRYSPDIELQTDLWKRHLRFGGQPNHHAGKYTYEAALYPQHDRRYSRLPLNAKGERILVPLTALSQDLQSRISDSLNGKRPVLLSGEDLRSILELLDEQTAVEVIGNILPNDETFSMIGDEGACGPCPPKVSKTSAGH